MPEEFKCEECGRSFDTKRGLSSHQAQSHKVDTGTEKSLDFSLSMNQALIAVFILGLAVGFFAGAISPVKISPSNPDTGQDIGNQDSQQSETIDMSKIEMDGEPALGSQEAPVTMVIYEDFECPFCKRFETNTFPEIKRNYVDTGKVRIIWKDLPLPERIHPWADEGAEAMECVYREGGNDAFWAVKNKLFNNQESIDKSNVYTKIKSWAAEEGISGTALQACIDAGEAMKEVQQDKQEGQKLGVSGTPTAIIEGTKLVGAQPYSRFKSVIDSELN